MLLGLGRRAASAAGPLGRRLCVSVSGGRPCCFHSPPSAPHQSAPTVHRLVVQFPFLRRRRHCLTVGSAVGDGQPEAAAAEDPKKKTRRKAALRAAPQALEGEQVLGRAGSVAAVARARRATAAQDDEGVGSGSLAAAAAVAKAAKRRSKRKEVDLTQFEQPSTPAAVAVAAFVRLGQEPGRGGASSSSVGAGPSLAAAAGPADELAPSFIASPDQQLAIDLVRGGRNVFVTGCAGTGKSRVLNEVRRRLVEEYGEGEFQTRVAVCAMTGLAATLVDGITLHSLLKLGRLDTHDSFERMYNTETCKVINDLELLIIDEASMLSAELLQALDFHLTAARAERHGSQKPFGGLQLVLVGDVYQLAPIEVTPQKLQKADRQQHGHSHGQQQQHGHGHGHLRHGAASGAATSASSSASGGRDLRPDEQRFMARGFFFQAPAFKYGGFQVVELRQVFRQGDANFIANLNAIRRGSAAEAGSALASLSATCARELRQDDGIKPTRLFARNKEVDDLNETELAALPTSLVTFDAVDRVVVTAEPPASTYAELVAARLVSPERMEQLMGQVNKLLEDRQLSATQRRAALDALFDTHELRLAGVVRAREAWLRDATSRLEAIAKEYGLFNAFQASSWTRLKEEAQVMLVRNLNVKGGLVNGTRGVVARWEDGEELKRRLRGAAALLDKPGADNDVVTELMLEWLGENMVVPVVKVAGGKGGSKPREVEIPPVVFSAVVPGLGECFRAQVPLKLAWAITVHKSQGMSLDRVAVDVSSIWGHGQLYTALSRARSTEGLQITGKATRKLDSRVVEWYAAGQEYRNPQQQWPEYPWAWEDLENHRGMSRGNNAAAVAFFREAIDRNELMRLRVEKAERESGKEAKLRVLQQHPEWPSLSLSMRQAIVDVVAEV